MEQGEGEGPTGGGEAQFATIGGLTSALYRAISGPPGGQDFALFRRACHPQSRMVRTGVDGEGRPTLRSFSADRAAPARSRPAEAAGEDSLSKQRPGNWLAFIRREATYRRSNRRRVVT